MNVQRFLLASERKENNITIGYNGRSPIDNNNIIIWMGRPLQYPPADPLLSRWSHIALLNKQPCWVEKVGNAVPLSLIMPISTQEARYIFSQVQIALYRLHQADCCHGNLSLDCIWLQPYGVPLLTGIGRSPALPEEDLQQLHLLAIQATAISSHQPLSSLNDTPLPASLPQKLASLALPKTDQELTLDILEYPSVPELALFEEDEHTQARGLLEISQSSISDMTGSFHLQTENNHHVQLYLDLEEWLDSITLSASSTDPFSSAQIQQLLAVHDPLSTPVNLTQIEQTEPKWEHTEHNPTVELSISETHSKTIYKRARKRPKRILFLFILMALLFGFLIGRI